MKVKRYFVVLLLAISAAFYHCQSPDTQKMSVDALRELQQKFSTTRYYSAAEAESLLVDIVSYIGPKPGISDHISRFNPEYKSYYQGIAESYEILFYHLNPDSTHYYYVERPARSLSGSRRGVGGSFRRDAEGKITAFEETFNTPPSDDSLKLLNTGAILFMAMIDRKDLQPYLSDTSMVEWPDDRLKYDREKHEWRYIE